MTWTCAVSADSYWIKNQPFCEVYVVSVKHYQLLGEAYLTGTSDGGTATRARSNLRNSDSSSSDEEAKHSEATRTKLTFFLYGEPYSSRSSKTEIKKLGTKDLQAPTSSAILKRRLSLTRETDAF